MRESVEVRHLGSGLERDISDAARVLSCAVRASFASVGLSDERSPRSLASVLRVDPKLAWRLVHLTAAEVSLQTARFVPGQGSIKTLARALERLGCESGLIESVHRASVVFESAVERHLGSRRDLEAMLAGAVSDPSDALAVELRRSGFESSASLLGIRADSQDLVMAQFLSEDGDYIDMAGVRATIGLERLRPTVPWRIARPYQGDRPADERRSPRIEALEGAEESHAGLHLAPELCSSPLPEFVAHELESGITEFELEPGPLGLSGKLDVVCADRWRDSEAVRHASGESPRTRMISRMRVPCRKARWVLFTPETLFTYAVPQASIYTMLWRGDTNFTEADRLPLHLETRRTTIERVEGEDASLARIARWLMARVAGRADDWVMTIAEVAYPPVVSAASFSWERRPAE